MLKTLYIVSCREGLLDIACFKDYYRLELSAVFGWFSACCYPDQAWSCPHEKVITHLASRRFINYFDLLSLLVASLRQDGNDHILLHICEEDKMLHLTCIKVLEHSLKMWSLKVKIWREVYWRKQKPKEQLAEFAELFKLYTICSNIQPNHSSMSWFIRLNISEPTHLYC